MKFKLALFALSLTIVAPRSVAAAPSPSTTPKTYAVFLATFNPETGETTGGVAGSAFFVSPTKAITAFHVLQPKSFLNPRTQIWLVHENEPAIELSKSDLTSNPSLDRTTINLKTAKAPKHYIFQTGAGASEAQPLPEGTKVETEGFLANSTGPILTLSNVKRERDHSSLSLSSNVPPSLSPSLKITSVPHLSRLHSEGSILRKVRIELSSDDVNLKNAPCVQVSYKPVVGLSGGPVFTGQRVIGMNSFADPEARLSTWAVDVSTN